MQLSQAFIKTFFNVPTFELASMANRYRLFLYCFSSESYYLSFPTRRSSDLSWRVTVRGRGGHGSRPHDTIDPVLLAAHIDRKSTRLNSSHVEISYAVFCLKKKN